MKLIKASTAVAALFTAVAVYAQQDYPRDLTLSWSQPTQYVDGTTIGAGELRGALATCWRHNSPNDFIVDEEVPAPNAGGQYSYTFVGVVPGPGTYVCGMFAVTVDDIYSDMSNTVDRKYTGKPLPPQNVTIVVE